MTHSASPHSTMTAPANKKPTNKDTSSRHPLLLATQELSKAMDELTFAPPVAFVYNPLDYAWEVHREYLVRYGLRTETPRAILLGMNPGPFGMAQTGVPFGAVDMARDWLGLDRRGGDELTVGTPAKEHPKRPVSGFGCTRQEVSGQRLWGWARDTFGTPEKFFDSFFVVNYCPLLFLHEGGRNLTPDKLVASDREPLREACDHHLARIVATVNPDRIIGIGTFAETAAQRVFGGRLPIGRILHPSPASPIANRGWPEAASEQLRQMGYRV